MKVTNSLGSTGDAAQQPPLSSEEIAELLEENARLLRELRIEQDKLREAFGL